MPENEAHSWVNAAVIEDAAVAPTARLELLESRHAADLFEAADREIFRHTAQGPEEWSVRGFEREMEKVKAVAGVVAYAIVLREGGAGSGAGVGAGVGGKDWAGRAIGRTTYMDIRPEHRGLEIGRTWIGRAWQGTRVNPEVKYLMLRHAFERMSPSAIRVQITTNGTNLHSQGAIAKLGAVKEGVLRKARIMPEYSWLERPGSPVRDWVIFSILDEEWARVKAGLEERLRRAK